MGCRRSQARSVRFAHPGASLAQTA
jgi:hypothetical protein